MPIYDQFISTKLQAFMMQQDQERQLEHKKKDSFWSSEAEAPVFDLYHKWIGTPVTNPIDAEKLVMFSAGKMMELALVEQLQKMGIAKKIEDDRQTHFRMEREGVPISGYMDAIFIDGSPCEVKTFYGDYQARDLKAGKPRTSYLKQLAIYMDALDQYRGKLIYLDRGTGEMYEFTLVREPDSLDFKCLNVEFCLTDTYKKWARLYKNNIIPKVEPTPEHVYKLPLDKIDWSKIPKSQITKARMNKAVIGHWEPKYSAFKNLYIEREKTQAGYSTEELALIKEQTKGYSNGFQTKIK
jgi:hypothetical protein